MGYLQTRDELIWVDHVECDAESCLAALAPLMNEWGSPADNEAYRDL